MDIWYTENHTDNVRLSIRIDRQLASVQSEFQRIDVFDSVEFGRIMTLDGLLMVTEKDEYIYHEMITHIPMATNPSIKKVLVIGAGDGGTVRELCRYPSIEQIDMVEIDELVVHLAKEYLPFTACSLDDPRVHIYYQDGLRFVRKVENEYDLIIVDSTDPFGVGEGLFTKEFYGNCYKALTEDGILVNQHESTFYTSYSNAMKRILPHCTGLPGTYPHLSLRALALWICVQKVRPGTGSAGRLVEWAGHQNQVLQHDFASGLFCYSE